VMQIFFPPAPKTLNLLSTTPMKNLEWMYRDPLRGVFSFDEFPYRRPEGHIEVDFIIKGFLYGASLTLGLWLWEAMVVTTSVWVVTNFLRRNSK